MNPTVPHSDKKTTKKRIMWAGLLLFAIVLLFSVFFWGGWLRRNFSPNNVADSCVFISKQEFSREFYGQLFEPEPSQE